MPQNPYKKFRNAAAALVAPLIFVLCAHLAVRIYHILKDALNTVPVEVNVVRAGTGEDLVRVYRISGNNKFVELAQKNGIWVSDKNCYVKGIVILAADTAVRPGGKAVVSIGGASVESGFDAMTNLAGKDLPERFRGAAWGYRFYKFPAGLSPIKKTLFNPVLKDTINWNGDRAVFIPCIFIALGYLAVFAAVLFLLLLSVGKKFPDGTYIILVFLAAITVSSLFAIYQVDPHHDGIMLKPAADVAAGKMIFRDTFSQYGALTTLVQALAIKAAGAGLMSIRLFTSVFYGLIAVLLWLVYSRILSKALNTALFFIMTGLSYYFIDHSSLLFLPWSTVYCVFSILLAMYLLILYDEGRGDAYLFASGAAVSCIFWFKINYGMTAALIFVPVVIILEITANGFKSAVKKCALLCAGWGLISAVFLFWLYINGALGDFWLQSVKFAAQFSTDNWNDGGGQPIWLQVIFRMFQINSTQGYRSPLWTLLPLICVFYAFKSMKLLSNKGAGALKNRAVFILSSVSAGFWVDYFPVNSVFHMSLTAIPMAGMAVYFAWDAGKKLETRGRLVVFVTVITLLFAYDIVLRLDNLTYKIPELISSVVIEQPGFLKGMRVTAKDAAIYSDLAKNTGFIKDGGGIINLTNAGLYPLYDANGKNFHKMYVNWDWANNSLYPDYFVKLREALERNNSVVISGYDMMIRDYAVRKIYPPLGGDFAENEILSVPAVKKDIFSSASAVIRQDPADKDRYSLEIYMKPSVKTAAEIDSIIIYAYTDELDTKCFGYNEFNYGILPRAGSLQDRQLINESYEFRPAQRCYALKIPVSQARREKLNSAFFNLFLSGRAMAEADTFDHDNKNRLKIYKNNILVQSDGHIKIAKGDSLLAVDGIDALVGSNRASKARVRVNFEGTSYTEIVMDIGAR